MVKRGWVAILLAMSACGGGGGGGDADAIGPGARHARFSLIHFVDVPQSGRAELLAARAEIEAGGYTLTDDGSQIRWPAIPASGWLIEFGDLWQVSDFEGLFTFEFAADTTDQGTVAHPQQIDEPIFSIHRADLAPASDAPRTIEFEVAMAGPCGMNAGGTEPDPIGCTDFATAGHDHHGQPPAAHGGHDHRHDHQGDAPPPTLASINDPAGATTSGPLGTYPAGNQSCCRDYDGGNWDPTTTAGVLWNYLGSTCDMLIESGCCSGELGSVTASALSSIGLLRPVGCTTNHKFRWCQETTQYDISGQFPAGIAGYLLGANPLLQPVHVGETIDFTLHNNDCRGRTFVAVRTQEIFGVLAGPAYDGRKVDHFTTTAYAADQPMQYSTARCMSAFTGTPEDLYWFFHDRIFAVRFQLVTSDLYQLVDVGSVFSSAMAEINGSFIAGPDAGCDSEHVHGVDPCTGAADPDPSGCGHGRVTPYSP